MTVTLLPALLMLLSGSIHAVVNAMIKGGGNRMIQMALSSGTGALIALPLLPFVPLPDGSWVWLLSATAIHLVYFYCLVRAFDAGDLSSAYPIFRGLAPLLSTLMAVTVLRETVTIQMLAGIALIGCGMFAMVLGRHVNRATLLWSLATGVLIALYTVIDAVGVRASPTPFSFIVWLFLMMGIASMTILPLCVGAASGPAIKAQWKSGAIAGLLSFATFGLALFALAHGPTGPLSALRETGMVTALLISIFVLKEPVTPGRIAAILAICVGAIIIIGA
jgi:drug/metabolite transporter (DMT)-like permease